MAPQRIVKCCISGCKADFRHQKRYFIHLLKKHNHHKSGFSCFKKECAVRVQNLSELETHLDSHRSFKKGPPATLSFCLTQCQQVSCHGYKTENLQDIFAHLNKDHSTENKVCPFVKCYKTFLKIRSLKAHIKRNHQGLNHQLKGRINPAPVEESHPILNPIPDPNTQDLVSDPDLDPDLDPADLEDEDPDENEDKDQDEEVQYKTSFADFLNRLGVFHFVPQTIVMEIVQEMSLQVKQSYANSEKECRRILNSHDVAPEVVLEISNELRANSFVKAVETYSSNHKLQEFNKKEFPVPQPINVQIEGKKNVMSYTSVIETITTLWKDPTFQECISIKNRRSGISDITDGSVYKNNPYFVKHPDALCLQIYSDCVNVSNVLGASKNDHKLQMFYLQILNIPSEYRSKIDNSYLIQVARYNEVKNSPEAVLKLLVQELQILEQGIQIQGDTVRAGLLVYCGDNMECHEIGGFQYGFSSGFPCRFCLIPYKQLQVYPPSFKYPQVWTVEFYDKIVATLPQVNVPVLTVVPDEPEELIDEQYERPRNNDEDFEDAEAGQEGEDGLEGQDGDDEPQEYDHLGRFENITKKGKFGLKRRCPFNVLESFHAVESMPNDIFHDIFEGAFSYDVASAIRIMVNIHLYSVDQLNRNISNYPFGCQDLRDKPRPLKQKSCKDERLPGKAMAVANMLNIFPFLVEEFLVNNEICLPLELVLKAGRILEMILLPTFLEGDILALQDLIIEYFDLRKKSCEEYPQMFTVIKPKHHFLSHIPGK